MKATISLYALCRMLPALAAGQTQVASGDAALSTSVGDVLVTAPASTPYVVVGRGENLRTWERTNHQAGAFGRTVRKTERYVEVATGLHFQRNGQGPWLETSEHIGLLPGESGAAATNGAIQVFFPNDIYSGVLDLIAPDGVTHFKSRPLGIALFDGTNSVLLAELTNSAGQILPSGRDVIYTNAFVGEPGLSADILVSYRRRGVSCDLVLRQWPSALSPADYGLGAGCRLQLLTELLDTPQPIASRPVLSRLDGLTDTTLDFKGIKLGPGRAFRIGAGTSVARPGNPGRERGVPVFKSYQIIEGRRFLVEETPLSGIQSRLNGLASLNQPEGLFLASSLKNHRQAGSKRVLPPSRLVEPGESAMQIANKELDRCPGVVLDYETVDGQGITITFQSDTTYYVSGQCNADNFIIEGGSVIKFPESGEGSLYVWPDGGGIICNTGPYRMAVLTSVNDDSCGVTIDPYSSGLPSQGQGTYLCPADDNNSYPLKHLRFCYAWFALQIGPHSNGDNGFSEVWDSQFVNCQAGVDDYGCPVSLHNVLFSGCTSVAAADGWVN